MIIKSKDTGRVYEIDDRDSDFVIQCLKPNKGIKEIEEVYPNMKGIRLDYEDE
jgi:hypothetical protein